MFQLVNLIFLMAGFLNYTGTFTCTAWTLEEILGDVKSEMEPTVRILRVNYVLPLWHLMVTFPFLRSRRFTAERHVVRFQNLAIARQGHGSRRSLARM